MGWMVLRRFLGLGMMCFFLEFKCFGRFKKRVFHGVLGGF